MDNLMLNNKIYLEGKVTSELEFSHEMYGEGFYTFNLDVMRLSDSVDTLNITVSERLLSDMQLIIGSDVIVEVSLDRTTSLLMGQTSLYLQFLREILNHAWNVAKILMKYS